MNRKIGSEKNTEYPKSISKMEMLNQESLFLDEINEIPEFSTACSFGENRAAQQGNSLSHERLRC